MISATNILSIYGNFLFSVHFKVEEKDFHSSFSQIKAIKVQVLDH